jgi:hypothetical protein
MEPEIIETVLKEILDEIKIIHQEIATKDKHAEDLKNKIQLLENTLDNHHIKPQEINLLSFQLQLDSNAKKLERIINQQPRNITRKIQILLFPETGAREYYKLVFGRLIFWMMMVLLATYLFSLGKQFIDNWKEVSEKKNELIQLRGKLPDDVKSIHKNKPKK